MKPLLTFLPYPTSDLGNLLALLELARVGGDPIDNPTPWAWETWQKIAMCTRAPWLPTATLQETGMSKDERDYSRVFVASYHATGDSREDRVRFATELSEGDAYKGRIHLTLWWRRAWDGESGFLERTILYALQEAGIMRWDRRAVSLR